MSDKELILGCQQNDPKSQTAFYQKYKGRLMGICRRYAKNPEEAEDILQESFIKIFRSIAEIRNPDAIVGWMKRIVTNTALNYYRSQLHYPQTVDYQDISHSNDDYWKLMAQLSNEEIVKVINTLPDGYRIVFNLYVIDGYDHAEIGQMLGISENTSRSQLFKARDVLKKKLKELGIVNYEQQT
ncbi:RNA polymerase sigma factor [Cytophagaceae bacterium DM2B3-1]|uniref:RNA polymerase sigma factor n=1 Tax=Xanthocytophaga flava TaxID=3048013 RepID=A0ABT7CNW7_9BACT|nr:RNA polymerase sigma factor [Xanthocytophaga flavus]MDJ1466217.1 RNA polymerase sigma factor [Xanthocytophaga flavus]MDJ1495422.1 RNA polymerase sigma factor [Xanthocytophaga flavus]